MSNVSTVFIVTDAQKAALETWAAGDDVNPGQPFDCVASLPLRVEGTTGTTPTHWAAHGRCTEAERAVLEAAEDLELLSIDQAPIDIVPRDHFNQVLSQFGLERIPSEDP